VAAPRWLVSNSVFNAPTKKMRSVHVRPVSPRINWPKEMPPGEVSGGILEENPSETNLEKNW
jgi:hypothetical protein